MRWSCACKFVRSVAGRLLSAVPVVFGVVVLTFVLMRVLPGDPASLFASSPSAGRAEIAAIRSRLGLDQPIPTQFLIYLRQLSHGDLGMSMTTGQPVLADLEQRLPASLELDIVALILAILVALPLGVAAAIRQGTLLDHAVRVVCTFGIALPTFVSGLLLIYVCYDLTGWAPDPTGRLDIFMTPPPTVTGFLLVDSLLARDFAGMVAAMAKLVLPACTLMLFVVAPVARITRASMLDVLASDVVRTAKAMGLRPARVIFGVALRIALLPVLTVSGTVVSSLLGASVLVEKVFAWPGIAAYAIDALMSGDFAPVQGFVLLMACLYVLANLLVDLSYQLADPRVSLA